MPVKIKFQLASMMAAFPRTRKVFNQKVSEELGAEINREIRAGKSPVEGQGRFKDYSDRYKDQIEADEGIVRGTDGQLWTGKRLRPVNLFVSGTMQKSQHLEETEIGVRVGYTSEFADYHSEGKGHLPRRAMLPSRAGEKFSRTINTFLFKKAREALDTILKI